MKRPLSVWLVQVLLLAISVLALPGLITWTVVAFKSLWGSSKLPADVALFYLDFAIRIGVLALFVSSFVAIWKRWPRSRVMGLVALLVLFALFAYGRFNPPPPGQGLPRMEYSTPAERGGAFILDSLLFIAFWVLFFRFGFSKKARDFLSSNSAADPRGQEPRAS